MSELANQINPERLKIARLRRKMTIKNLAKRSGLSSKSLSEYEKINGLFSPTLQTASLLSDSLEFPIEFFYGGMNEIVDPTTISFRSTKKLKASEQHAAEAAASLGLIINKFFESRFKLPKSSLPDMQGFEAENAANYIRDYWGLGDEKIPDLVHLLECKGVRVYSISEDNLNVDAFSFWKDGTPFIFLNDKKSGERSRFDAAHELAHLLLHKNASPQGRNIEEEANSFASAFLMPSKSVQKKHIVAPSLAMIEELKKNWMVSTVALIVRMKNIGCLSDWQYRNLMSEATRQGLRENELNGIEREKSNIIKKILNSFGSNNSCLEEINKETNIPISEVANFLFGLECERN
ncbi:helix-turn-helix domain-containing protein [Citrobacter amalonaticus]|uniref:helix-turn-helix domain-containing protein n=1 Tax=Citrobacter amalonaticus TaxID=35703 RepID=UPI003DA1C237